MPSCNARKRMKLPEGITNRKQLLRTFEGNRCGEDFMVGQSERNTNTKRQTERMRDDEPTRRSIANKCHRLHVSWSTSRRSIENVAKTLNKTNMDPLLGGLGEPLGGPWGGLEGSDNQSVSNRVLPLSPCTLIPLHPYTHIPWYPDTLIPLYPCTLVPFCPNTLIPLYPYTLIPLHPYTLTALHPH